MGWKKSVSIYPIKRADLILISLCLLTAGLLSVYFMLHREQGSTAVLSCDGVELSVISLPESGTTYYLVRRTKQGVSVEKYTGYPELPTAEAFNLFAITDGSVKMEAADCKDQICVHHRPILSVGESVICLPHRLVVEITDGEEDRDSILDGVVE